jgi:RNA polymerase sigma-70 factor (ECF subfamily)
LDAARERTVIAQVLSGDPEPFSEIVRKYQNLVASVAYRMGVRRGTIEDVASEVFMKVFTRLHQYDSRYALSSWIYRITTNHVLDEIRKSRHTSPKGLDELPEPRDTRVDIAGDAVITERDELVRQAVFELPDEYARILVLKHFEELSVLQIAEVLDMPEGTVKIRLMRGRERLKKILERRHPEHFGALAAEVPEVRS